MAGLLRKGVYDSVGFPVLHGLLTFLCRRQKSVWFWSLLSGAYGLFFGALCSIPYFLIGGPSMAFTWWVAGIPYDLVHCLSNGILCMVLFRPLNHVLNRLKA